MCHDYVDINNFAFVRKSLVCSEFIKLYDFERASELFSLVNKKDFF